MSLYQPVPLVLSYQKCHTSCLFRSDRCSNGCGCHYGFLLCHNHFLGYSSGSVSTVKTISKKTSVKFDDVLIEMVEHVRAWVYTLVALYIALQFFSIPTILDKILTGLFFFALVWQFIESFTILLQYFTTNYLEKDEDGDGQIDPNSANISNLVSLIAKIVLWSLGLLFVLSNMGIEVTSLLAGLGIGGLAIAFALQGVLSDLFASFSIYFDKPFRIGDFIVIGADSGTVEKLVSKPLVFALCRVRNWLSPMPNLLPLVCKTSRR